MSAVAGSIDYPRHRSVAISDDEVQQRLEWIMPRSRARALPPGRMAQGVAADSPLPNHAPGGTAERAHPAVGGGIRGEGRTLLIAATGGHLSELYELHSSLPALQHAPLWFVPASEQCSTLLRGHDVIVAPDVHPRDVRALPAAMSRVNRLLVEHDVDCAVSTGAGIALAAFAAARVRGIACHYIESAARVEAPSLTGRLLQAMPGVHLWSQNAWTEPGRWKTAPSVFDGYRSAPRAVRPGPLRVVVTLGTMRYGFRRLVEQLVTCLPPDAEVMWQIGTTDVNGLDIDARPWISPTSLSAAVRDADVVIAHAGVGSALMALNGGLCPILVPRRRKHGEHVDDHQVQVAADLARRGLASSVDPEQLSPEVLFEASARLAERVVGEHDDLVLQRSRRQRRTAGT